MAKRDMTRRLLRTTLILLPLFIYCSGETVTGPDDAPAEWKSIQSGETIESVWGAAWNDVLTSATMSIESLVQWFIESWNWIINNIMTNVEEWRIAISE